VRNNKKVEFGDFQTPYELAIKVCERLVRLGFEPQTVIEPTCGTGSFVVAAINTFPSIKRLLAIDINPQYIAETARQIRGISSTLKIQTKVENFFEIDWVSIHEQSLQPTLFLGNPPWVTSATLGGIGSSNTPIKSNFQNHSGLDAITGKANFDISEWMLLRLMGALCSGGGGLAMLCKTAVARKLLMYAGKIQGPLRNFYLFPIDAAKYFGVAVEACLFVYKPMPHQAKSYNCRVYRALDSSHPLSTIGYREGIIVSDTKAYDDYRQLIAHRQSIWRSGIKHDCANVMELRRENGQYTNRLGERVYIEDNYLYPMLKSADLANNSLEKPRLWMIVPQREVFEETSPIEHSAPKTWEYLTGHRQIFANRASVIYRGKPQFSIFGVGAYSFASWKIAVAGLYKTVKFRLLGTYENKPWILDDTCYFLQFNSQEEAESVYAILTHPKVSAFYQLLIFGGNKRPITKEILDKLDIEAVAKFVSLPLIWQKSADFTKVMDSKTLPLPLGNARSYR